MDGASFVLAVFGIFLDALVAGFNFFITLLSAHGGSLYNFYWGAIAAFLAYVFYIKPAISRSRS